MTRRKAAQREHPESAQDLAGRVIAEVRVIAARPCVVSLGDHFAGYFNELGIFVGVADDAQDSEVIDLRNAMLAYLDMVLPEESALFKWQVGIKRDSKTIEVIFPGDLPRSRDDFLQPI